jgi:aminoglycoside phosphotransferase (APT) family kinase protein
MQEGWERIHDPVDLSLETLSEMVAPVFAPRTVVKAELLSGGLANTNYKVGISGLREPFVMRVYMRDPSACAREVDIYLRVRGVVPVPTLLFVDTEGQRMGYPYTLANFVEGELMTQILVTGGAERIGQAGYAAGWTLALLGQFTFPAPGEFGPELVIAESRPGGGQAFLAYLEPLLTAGRARERLGNEAADRIWAFAREHAPMLDAVADEAKMVHADYKATNLLLREEAERLAMAAVLDWEFACAGAQIFDMGILLRHDRELDLAFVREFARGFTEAGGALPQDWRRMARLADFVNLVTFLDAPEERNALFADVTRLLVETLERWDEE